MSTDTMDKKGKSNMTIVDSITTTASFSGQPTVILSQACTHFL